MSNTVHITNPPVNDKGTVTIVTRGETMNIYGSVGSVLHGNEQLHSVAASTPEFVRTLTGFVTNVLYVYIRDIAALPHALQMK